MSAEAPTYSEKLLDPRWQRKRLEAMQRDDFKCRDCKRDTITLHVHHLHYAESGNPWDVKNKDLVTLCKHCHTRRHNIEKFDPGLVELFRNLPPKEYPVQIWLLLAHLRTIHGWFTYLADSYSRQDYEI